MFFSEMPPTASPPVYAHFPSEKLTIGAGVAIFHLASARVVVCYHPREQHWFLPKGRRNANEDTIRAAEREGFEESGYRNRVLALPLRHRQPVDPDDVRAAGEGSGSGSAAAAVRFVREPIWTQLLPLTATSQYLLFWFAAETLPGEVEREHYKGSGEEEVEGAVEQRRRGYVPPPPFPEGMSLRERMELDRVGGGVGGEESVYEPVRHSGTGVDADELLYESYLLPIEEARRKLKGSIMEDVVRRAWDAVQLRLKMEEAQG